MAQKPTVHDASHIFGYNKPGSSFHLPKKDTKLPIIPVAPPIDAEEYAMNNIKRGKAIIFNHIIFSGSNSPRHGAVLDAAALKEAFEMLHFTVETHENLTKQKIFSRLSQVAEADHSNEDCLVVIVMTHGDPNVLSAYDTSYRTSKLWESFTADKCKTLVGKPKLFFIQACRGDMVDSGVRVQAFGTTQTDGVSRAMYTIPTMADILIANATYDGHYAWRSSQSGSWFIQALCKELLTHGYTKEICQILTRVNRRVAIGYSSYVPENPKMDAKKQMPNFLSTLTRDLYFRPKHTHL